MVQTEQQYICIHQCLMAVLEGKENTGPQREIHDNQGYEGESSDVTNNFMIKIFKMKAFVAIKIGKSLQLTDPM